MARSRRRRQRQRRRSAAQQSWNVPDTFEVIEQADYRQKPYRAARAPRRPRRAQSAFMRRLEEELRRRARESRPSPRSLAPNALARDMLDDVRRPFTCKPRPDSSKAGRSPKRKRGSGGGSREWKPWCKG